MELEEEQKREVERNLNEKVIVNAPPGSGKTETIIQKLVYICNNNIADLKDILVICFSRAAVKEIKERVEQITGIRNRIDIRTIDSFCSWVIRELEDNYKEKFAKLNYDERIEYVTNLIKYEKEQERYNLILQINSLKHIIIDEFQDIVGIRAKFIIELLGINKKCGFSLFGDEYQAIYNYQAKDMTADDMILKIKEMYRNCKEIEYKSQHRENDQTQKNRNFLVRELIKRNRNNAENLNKVIKKAIFKELETKNIEETKNKKTVILTRKNGEVYEIASRLEDIPYKIQQYTNELVFPAWIAYLLSDYTNAIITKQKFEEIAREKLKIENTEEYWNYCKKIESIEKIIDNNPDELELQKFKENLIIDKGNYPEDLEKEQNKLIISTIHKAKGREYDEVYLHYRERCFIQDRPAKDVFDNARLLYVAITRAKEKCYKYDKEINGIYFKSYNDNRQERYYGFINRKGRSYKIVRKIEFGLDGDIDNKSFIDAEIVGDVQKNQEYIFNEIKEGDFVNLIRENDIFYIYHNERKIGVADINDIYSKTMLKANNWRYIEKEVLKYRNVRVKKVITIAQFPDFIEDKYELPYRDTGLWIGIQLEGFGELQF